MKAPADIRTVDVFAGGGGLSLGFMNSGFNVVAAYDNWPAAVRFYRRNITTHPVFEADLTSPDMVRRLEAHAPDMIIGGPPCQDFSSAGKRCESDRANLTVLFAELVASVRPRYFVMENVERSKRSRAFASASEILQESGYGLTAAVLDASLCGVPQRRKRLFLFGDKGGDDTDLLPFILLAQGSRPMTLRDYFGDQLGVEHYYRHPRSYARRGIFSIDEPSPTVRGVNRPVPAGYPGHPGDPVAMSPEIRALTTKERSLIQTFPESFDISGPKSEVEQIVGNAVPVKLAEFVARRIADYLAAEHLRQDDEGRKPHRGMQALQVFEQRPEYADHLAAAAG
jgi:DNA (cytosine-5)-methyltransferase 1